MDIECPQGTVAQAEECICMPGTVQDGGRCVPEGSAPSRSTMRDAGAGLDATVAAAIDVCGEDASCWDAAAPDAGSADASR